MTVGTILGLLAAGRTNEEILPAYPYLEADDIRAALVTPPDGLRKWNCPKCDVRRCSS